MQLEKSLNKTLAALVVAVLMLVFSVIYSIGTKHTFAEGEGEAWQSADGYFVNFYDSGEYYDFCNNTFFSNNKVSPFGATKPKGAIVVITKKIEEYK